METQLRRLYPNLTLLPNDKTAINSELDFYYPDLRLGFELNGIFHYKPIYGAEKLASVQLNDALKLSKCASQNISLYVVDCTKMVSFNESQARVFLETLCDIIDQNL